MEPSTDIELIRGRFRELDTAVLLDLWQRDERMPHAETALRAELIDRGLDAIELDGIVAQREAIAAVVRLSKRENIGEHEVLERFLLVFLAAALGTLTFNLFGLKVAAMVVSSLLLGYVCRSTIRIFRQLMQSSGAVRGLFMVYQLLESLGLGLFGIALIYYVMTGRLQ